MYTIEGGFHSVNADGMTSQNYAIYKLVERGGMELRV